MFINSLEKDSRLTPIENCFDSNFLTFPIISLILYQLALSEALKLKWSQNMHPDSFHLNRYILIQFSQL